MTWLLMVIILNVDASPPQVHETKILEILNSEKECLKKHTAFFKGLKEQKISVPANFNLGCVLLKGTRI